MKQPEQSHRLRLAAAEVSKTWGLDFDLQQIFTQRLYSSAIVKA